MQKMNFHTHTTFCDGKNKAEDIVKQAINLGFSHIGFSGHAFVPFEKIYCMSIENTKRYVEEINRLRDAYSDRIKIYCGLEADYFSEFDEGDFDYLIGSCHYLERNGEYYPFDGTDENFRATVEAFDNDPYAVTDAYFKQMTDIVNKFNVDIIGHFDIISKFNDGDKFFSQKDERYDSLAKKTIDFLIEKDCIFEVNTGAMARGFKNVPYPSPELIEYIKEKNGKLILSSDCHDLNLLDYAFDETIEKYNIELAADELIRRLDK